MNKWIYVAVLGMVAGCGGDSAPSSSTVATSVQYQPGVYADEASLKNFCATPRSGKSPYTGQTYPDQAGSLLHEQLWLRSWSQRTYLWYRELPDLNPAGYSSAAAYFNLLKSTSLTDTGAARDRFHFTEDTSSYERSNVSDVSAGYGVRWVLRADKPPRALAIAYVEVGSPAANAGLQRGDQVLQVDGIDFVNDNSQAGVNTINAALSPARLNEAHSFVLVDVNGSKKTAQLTSADVAMPAVKNRQLLRNSAGAKLGYLQFNSFTATAQPELIAAVAQFTQQGVQDVVLDMRYNGGGSLALAAQLGYMLAGPNVVQGRLFNSLTFNDKYPSTNPVTKEALSPIPFYSKEIDYAAGKLLDTTLPALTLRRLYVLTTSSTCSASEALVNGLRGVDMNVVLIGSTTCGKPYGFYPTDNCGTTYYTVQFKGANAKGYGDYADGLEPAALPARPSQVQGCPVADDFRHALGDPAEGLLAAALEHSVTSSCPRAAAPAQASATSDTDGLRVRVYPQMSANEAIYQPIQ